MPVLRHMVQLDGLRAIAVLAVLVSHFGNSSCLAVRILPWGAMGVRLFFVLSGFLITGILLQCREYIISGEASGWQLVRKFYARRFLRIFPVYYAVLLTVSLANIRPVRDYFWWHVTYTSNIKYALQGSFAGPGSHFWSLAVEEQFYLVWPFLILFTPHRWLVPLNAAIVVLAIGFRSLGVWLGYNDLGLQILPIGCLDALGMGSLLAVLTSGGRVWPKVACRFANSSFWCGIVLFVSLALANEHPWGHKMEVALQVSSMAMIFVALVAWGARGTAGLAGNFLSCRLLVYIGKVSYGIYLYHAFIPVVGPRIFTFLGWLPFYQQFDWAINTAMAILLAAISWHFFEAPINRLKGRLNYRTGFPSSARVGATRYGKPIMEIRSNE
jgi:peptidoglycan/LPS O-acetylase OafA/YrhL